MSGSKTNKSAAAGEARREDLSKETAVVHRPVSAEFIAALKQAGARRAVVETLMSLNFKEPYREPEKPMDNYDNIEIKRAEVHEKWKTVREKMRLQTDERTRARSTEGYYFIRFIAMVAILAAMGISIGGIHLVMHAKDPPSCGDAVISIFSGAVCDCAAQRAVPIPGDKEHLLCTTPAGVTTSQSSQAQP